MWMARMLPIFVNAGIYAFNGIFTVITGGLYVLVMFVWSAVLLIPFRIIAVRKTTRVTDFEVKATLVVTVVGVVLSLAAGVLFMGTGGLRLMGVLFLSVLIFELPVYWGGLWGRKFSLQRELAKNNFQNVTNEYLYFVIENEEDEKRADVP